MTEKKNEKTVDFQHPIEQLIHCTVRLVCATEKGEISSGSGFFFRFDLEGKEHIPCIVTNKHVIKDSHKGYFVLTLANDDGTVTLGNSAKFEFDQDFEKMWVQHPDKNVDLAVFPIAPLYSNAKEQKKNFYSMFLTKKELATKELLDSISSMEDIVMLGYPIGLWDQKHNLPIIRQGVTATHPKLPYNGRAEFMIDAACFPGSSGSPVLLANIGSYISQGALKVGTRIALLGVLYAGPQFTAEGEVKIMNVPTAKQKIVSISDIPMNLGMVINSEKLLDFEQMLHNLVKKQKISEERMKA